MFQEIRFFIIYFTLYHKTIRPDPKFITWGLIWDLKQIAKFETLVINMEIMISVSEAELEEFPEEEIPESSGQ